MAFEFLRSETSASPIEKEIEATNGTTYTHGCAVSYGSSGTATLVTGTSKPEFIYTGKDITATTGDMLACTVVFPEYEWETYLAATGTSLKKGWKVTIGDNSGSVTATSASGVFELLTDGGASGAKVVGKFA